VLVRMALRILRFAVKVAVSSEVSIRLNLVGERVDHDGI
jgi:hypothetical protein